MEILKNGDAFVSCPSGGQDFGVVAEAEAKAANVRSGPVRLQMGFPGTKGYGFLHIETNLDRVKQLKGFGYNGVAAYCEDVATNYSEIGEVKDGRIALVKKETSYDKMLILQWKEAKVGYWTIVTAIATRAASRHKVLCKKSRTSESEPTPDVAKRPRFATLSLPKKT